MPNLQYKTGYRKPQITIRKFFKEETNSSNPNYAQGAINSNISNLSND